MTDAFFQSPPQLGNQYLDDRPLRQLLRRLMPEDALRECEPSLQGLGELAATTMLAMRDTHRRDEPVHIPYDPWGRRIDEVLVSRSWEYFARLATEQGLVATAYERRHGRFSRLHQAALIHLFDPSSQVYTCPLAMTDGCARTLELLAAPAIKERVLTRLISRDPDKAWTSGQWMTERTGGSDVGLSQTIALAQNDGTYRLYGTKWFTSAVTADVALTLARPEGNPIGGRGLALFLVEVRDANGQLNGLQINRLKEKLGTRHLPTAELTLNATVGVPLQGTRDGVKNMGTMLNITRTWNALCSSAKMRRGLALARDYARRRVAFGGALAHNTLHLDTLADSAAEYAAALQLSFFAAQQLGLDECGEADDQNLALMRLVLPLAKLTTAKQALVGASETLEAFGGAGYVEDTGLPELLRDAQVLSIWEGTTNVLAMEALRSIRSYDALRALRRRIDACLSRATDAALKPARDTTLSALEHAAAWLQAADSRGQPAVAAGARALALTLGRSLSLALLMEQAQWNLEHEGSKTALHAALRFASSRIDHLTAAQDDLESTALTALDPAD